jgi:predicted molibdopterin-dependent oxidoreductase YjgC
MAVKAVAQGKEAARAAMIYLQGNLLTEKSFFNSKFGKLKEEEHTEYLKESVDENRMEPARGFIAGFTHEEAISEAKRCLRCDCRKSQTCRLRNLSAIYQADQKKYNYGERKTIRKYFQHEILVYEPEKCIKCGLCIEIAAKNNALTGMAYIGRGFEMSVQVPFNKSMQDALVNAAQECIAACPTGALSDYKGEDNILPQISQINTDNTK